MVKFFNDLFTGADNATFDISRIGLALGILTYVGAVITTLCQGKAIVWLDLGGGFAAILGAGGMGIGLKAHAEPKGDVKCQ